MGLFFPSTRSVERPGVPLVGALAGTPEPEDIAPAPAVVSTSRSTIVDIADRVAETLADATLSLEVEPENIRRVYVPVYDPTKGADGEELGLDEEPPLIISVVPNRLDSALLDRGGREIRTFEIDVGIQKVVGTGTITNEEMNEACDPLLALAEEIAALFVGIRYDTVPPSRCSSSKNMPIYAPDHLNENRIFTSVVRLTFKYSG